MLAIAKTSFTAMSLALLASCGGGDPEPPPTPSVQALPRPAKLITASSSSSALAAAAVDLSDAIAILKMIVGLNVNATDEPTTVYQSYAADLDANGKVELADAILILKRVVGLEPATESWVFFNQANGAPVLSDPLSPGEPSALTAEVSSLNSTNVSLVSLLRGDVINSHALSYQWAITSKPTTSKAMIVDAATATPGFVADAIGAYQLEMTASVGGVNGFATVAVINADWIKQVFASTPLYLPDLKQKYDILCGRRVSVQSFIPIDLDNDGLTDFVAATWCRQTTNGLNVNDSVPNAIIVLKQKSDGTFFDDTFRTLGIDMPSVGGIAIDYLVTDFNQDGYPDIVFAVNREDGRGGYGDNRSSPQMSMMSNGNGTYRMMEITSPQYGYRVNTRSNIIGNNDVIFTTFSGNTAARFVGGQWIEIPDYNSLPLNGPIFLSKDSSIAIQPFQTNTDIRLESYRLSDSVWSKISSTNIIENMTQLVDFYSYDNNGIPSKKPLVNIDGDDYIDPGVAGICEYKTTDSTIIYGFTNYTKIIGGYHGGALYQENDPVYQYGASIKLLGFNVVDGKLQNYSTVINLSDNENIPFLRMNCLDINHDGYMDIFIESPLGWRGNSPIVLLGDKNNSFSRVQLDALPIPPDGTAPVIVDVDGDGINEILYYPLTGYTGDDSFNGNDAVIKSDSVKYKLYKGLRHFNLNDTK